MLGDLLEGLVVEEVGGWSLFALFNHSQHLFGLSAVIFGLGEHATVCAER